MGILRSKSHLIFLPFAAVLLIIIGFAFAQIFKPHRDPVPDDIARQLAFTPLVIPGDTKQITTSNYALSPADHNGKPPRFTSNIDDATVIITETQLPPQFTEIPYYKQRFLDTFILASETVGTASGTINYGAPVKQQSYSQVGMMTDHSILTLFSLQSSTLSQQQWRQLGDALTTLN